MIVRQTYQEVTARRSIKAECPDCGKVRSKVIKASQTISPFNKNDDGEIKSRSEILDECNHSLSLMDGLVREQCNHCTEKPMRFLLIQMAHAPESPVQAERNEFWNSPMHFLSDRGHVEERFERTECKCCGNVSRSSLGWFITESGKARASKFKADDVSAALAEKESE